MRTHASQHHDGQDDRRFDEGEGFRADEALARGEEAAGKAGEGGTDGEGVELDRGGIDTQRTAGHFVFAQRLPGPAYRHAQQPIDDEQGQQHQQQSEKVQEHHPVHRVEGDTEELVKGLHALAGAAAELQSEQVRLGNAADAVGAIGQGGEIVQQDADDLAETQGDDGEIVTAQAQHRKAQQKTEQRGHGPGGDQTGPEADAEIHRQQGIGIGADGVETDIAQIQQPGQPHHNIQSQAEHHVDQHQRGQVDIAAVAEERPDQRSGDQKTPEQPAHGRPPGENAERRRGAGQGRYSEPQRRQLIAEQVEQENEQRRCGDFHGHVRSGAGQYQPGALLADTNPHQQTAERDHHHGGDQRRFQIAHHTFSTSGRPRMPLGRNSRIRISRLKATTSLYSALK